MTPALHCESPIEERIARVLCNHLHAGVTWDSQRPIVAHGKAFRADFVAECTGQRVVIECDGREFHEYGRDRLRDAVMLDAGAVTDVVRFKGSDIYGLLEDCETTLRLFFPYLFDAGARPLDLEERVLGSSKLLGLGAMPIYRCRMGRSAWGRLPRTLADLQTVSLMGKTSDDLGCVVQFKSPKWRPTSSGRHPQPIEEGFNALAEDVAARENRRI